MARATTVEERPPAAAPESLAPPSPARFDSRRIAGAALLLLPAGLVVYFGFNDGGFFVGAPAYVAVLLCAVLVLRMTLAEHPLAGVGTGVSVVVGAFAVYTLITLLSQIWSHAPGRALEEFDRSLAYLLVMVLCGSIGHTRERFAWLLRGLAVAIFVLCLCGLITRLLPHFWPTAPDISNNRLSYPLTYWNALGIIGALGSLLCLHFSSDPRESPVTRVLAAGMLPILATTVYFTFSRGGIGAALVGVVVYLLVARPRLLLSSMVAIAPLTALAVKVAYDANLLATTTPTTPGAVAQGRHVALVVLLCALGAAALRALLALTLDRPLARFRVPERTRRPIQWMGWGGLACAIVIAAAVLHGKIANEYHGFIRPPTSSSADLRARLTSPTNDGRIELWRVAWHQFQRAPALGHGAGTFANTWLQHRPNQDIVLDAHSLYFETLDELGLVGLVLLVAVIVAVLVRTATRALGPDRPLYAAAFALIVMWALHAGFDWDWEMPAVTLPFFAIGGFVLARPVGASAVRRLGLGEPIAPFARVVLGLGCVLLAVAPAYMWLSQRQLNAAQAAFAQGNCQAATSDALSSISILGDRPDPYEIVGYCDVRRDMPRTAIAMIQKAVSLDPNNYDYAYDLAVMRASAGLDPMSAAYKAQSLDPHEPDIHQLIQSFKGASPSQLESRGKAIADSVDQF